MIFDKQKYHSSFQEVVEWYCSVLKDVGDVPSGWLEYVDGYMDAGLLLGITSAEEPDNIIQAANYKIFGMTVEERKKKYKRKTKVDENDLDIPTFIREGKSLEL